MYNIGFSDCSFAEGVSAGWCMGIVRRQKYALEHDELAETQARTHVYIPRFCCRFSRVYDDDDDDDDDV